MSLAVGPISLVQALASSLQLSCAAAAGGTGPYTYQWYKGTSSGFTIGAGSLISGATGLTLTDQNLQPGVQWFYAVQVTDTGNANATANSAVLGATTAAGSPLDPSQFGLIPLLGMPGRGMQPGTFSAVLDNSVAGPAFAGTAIKPVASPSGGVVPGINGFYNGFQAVVPCTANSDDCIGFIFRNFLDPQFALSGFPQGRVFEFASGSDEIYLLATANGSAGDWAQLDVSMVGGVQSKVGSSGAIVVGKFTDKPYVGNLARVRLTLPTLNFA